MSKKAKISIGIVLLLVVSGAIIASVNKKDKGVKQAMFYVLWRATMPSVLIEAGFISNRVEERRFKSRAFQTALAESITRGVTSYSKTYKTAMRR